MHLHAYSHITEYVCPTSKKCQYAVHLSHTLCTLKAQLYFLRSQWHPRYFRCPCRDCRVCIFIVSHHFRDHLPDPMWWRVRSWDLHGLCGVLCRVSIWGWCVEARAESFLNLSEVWPSELIPHNTSFTVVFHHFKVPFSAEHIPYIISTTAVMHL